jgi:gluconokinase
LKVSYRARLTASLPEARFVWLDPPRAVLEERTAHRPGHFMPAALLDSQLATLEPPARGEQFLRLDGTGSVEQEIAATLEFLQE